MAALRLAIPERTRMRPLSIEAVWIDSEKLDPGATVTRERTWAPPDDVYVVGWNPWLGIPPTPGFDAELMLYDPSAKTTIFLVQEGAARSAPGGRPMLLPEGTGYRAGKGQPVNVRFRITNTGPAPFETRGAGALVYFVPVAGN